MDGLWQSISRSQKHSMVVYPAAYRKCPNHSSDAHQLLVVDTCRPHSWHSGDIPESALYLPASQLSHLEAPVICTHIYTNIHTYFYIHILCIVPHRRILCMIFVVAQTQTHSTHTLSTPAVAWYLPALASSRELQVWHTSSIHVYMCICVWRLLSPWPKNIV